MTLKTEDSKLASSINNAVTRLIFGLLGVVFVTLKLVGTIDWSWWWVLAPFWGPLAVGISIVIALYSVAGILSGISKILDRQDEKKRKETVKRIDAAVEKARWTGAFDENGKLRR